MPTTDASPDRYPLDQAKRQRELLIRVVRLVFIAAVTTVTLVKIMEPEANDVDRLNRRVIPLIVCISLTGLVLLADVLTPRRKIASISGVFFGVLIGMLATWALGVVIDTFAVSYNIQGAPIIPILKVFLGICLCYLGVTTVLHTQDDFRLVIPYVEFAKQLRGAKPLILDSSALIDARLVELGPTGLVQAPVVIPQFVVAELQLLADSSDRLKRARGRRGLDVIAKLQRSVLDVTIDDTPVAGQAAVDQMLVELAQRMPGVIVTTDTALARIAQIQGASVINLNDVANALRPALLAGEPFTLLLVRHGEQPGQAIGYLDDGTMVVVDDAAAWIGGEVRAEVTSTLQTSAGRLVFARPSAEEDRRGPPAPASRPMPPHPPGADAPRAVPPPAPVLAAPAVPVTPQAGTPAAPGAGALNGGHGDAADAEGGGDAASPPPPIASPLSPRQPRFLGPFPPKPPARGQPPRRNPRR